MSTFLQALVDAVSSGALYGLAALGIGLVFGVLRLANFAHGELITAAAYTLILTWQYGPIVAIALAVLASVLLAVLMEVTIFRWMRGANDGTKLIASFGLSVLIQRIYEIAFGNNVRTAAVAPELSGSITVAGARIQLLSLVSILVAAVLLVAVHAFLTRTSVGLQVQAAATDFRTARLLGVRANVVILLTFAIAGGLAAVVGFFLTAQIGAVGPSFGVNITVMALIGAVIGGVSSLWASVAGGFFVGFIASVLATYLPGGIEVFRDAFVFGVVMVLLIFKPSGVLVRTQALERA